MPSGLLHTQLARDRAVCRDHSDVFASTGHENVACGVERSTIRLGDAGTSENRCAGESDDFLASNVNSAQRAVVAINKHEPRVQNRWFLAQCRDAMVVRDENRAVAARDRAAARDRRSSRSRLHLCHFRIRLNTEFE